MVRRAAQAGALAVVVGLLGLLIWRVATDERAAVPRVLESGERYTAPAFTLERLDRPGKLTLAQFRGKAVVLNFWASWCIPCEQEAPLLEQTWERNRSSGLVVVGINIEDLRSDARRFARRTGMTYPIGRDKGSKTFTRYAVSRLPETLFVNRRGQLVGERILGGVHLPGNDARFSEGVRLALGT